MRTFASMVLLLGAAACSSSTMSPGGNDDAAMTKQDGGVVTTGAPKFTIELVDGFGANHPRAGDNVVAALDPNGVPTVAYGSVQKGSTTYELWYASRGSDGTWAKEKIVDPGMHVMPAVTGQINGLGFAHVDGAPQVAYLGGGTDGNPLTPFPTDLMLSRKMGNAWVESTLAKVATDVTCSCPESASDYCHFGNVVGSYPAMRAKPGGGGYAIAFQDSHNGFAKDDLAFADADVYAVGGPVAAVCADAVRSGGTFADITYTRDKSLVLAYNLTAQSGPVPVTGVWTAAYDLPSMMWKKTRVHPGLSSTRLALGTAPDGTLYLAIADADNISLVVEVSKDNGQTWTETIVDQSGKTGLAPSVGFDGMGRAVIAYEYCGRVNDDKCPGTPSPHAEIRIARLEGSAWKIYKVDDGQGFGGVGLFTSIVFTPDGKMGIAYVDDMNGGLNWAREM